MEGEFWRNAHTEQQITPEEREENETPINNNELIERDGITREEIIEAITTLKRGNTPGHYSITTEMVKGLNKNGREIVEKLFTTIRY